MLKNFFILLKSTLLTLEAMITANWIDRFLGLEG